MNAFTNFIKGFSSAAFGKGMKQKQKLSKEALAKLLSVDSAALVAFEEAYQNQVLNTEGVSENLFKVNSRQAVKDNRSIGTGDMTYEDGEKLEDLKRRIIVELLNRTTIYEYDGNNVVNRTLKMLPENPVTNADIACIPDTLKPQLTGNLMKVDINQPSYPALLEMYHAYLTETREKAKKQAYHIFRQGLDILDLDDVVYRIIGTNPDSMGHWFPALVEACKGFDFFRIPATTIATVPLPLLQLTRQEYRSLTQTTLDIVDGWAYDAFHLDESKSYFIKTGTYSSKFDFRNVYVHGEKEVRELGEYLLYIHYQALMMASPLSSPCIYGASTTNEWVVREFIHDKENNPCIYKGLPLHTEYRVFVDCDTDKVISMVPYWEPNTMKERFSRFNDADSPHQIHDYVIYMAHEDVLMNRYRENRYAVATHIQEILPGLQLSGQWSIDIMQNGDEFWLIDMARAETSAFYECVPVELRKPSTENWLPEGLFDTMVQD